MGDAISGIPELIEQGSKFTYANFSSKSPRGFPSAYSDDWLVWTYRVSRILVKMEQSPISGSIELGLGINLLGQGEDDFQKATNSILSGLRAAQKVFGEPIPASDRTVALGHNSPEQTRALEKIDELVDAVNQANDLPITPEEREQLVAELSAGRRLLEASIVRLTSGVANDNAAGASLDSGKGRGHYRCQDCRRRLGFFHGPALVVRQSILATAEVARAA
jgi:hypothetical protein